VDCLLTSDLDRLEPVVRNAVDTARPFLDARGHALVVRLPPNDGGDSNKPIIAWMGAMAVASLVAAAGGGASAGRRAPR